MNPYEEIERLYNYDIFKTYQKIALEKEEEVTLSNFKPHIWGISAKAFHDLTQ